MSVLLGFIVFAVINLFSIYELTGFHGAGVIVGILAVLLYLFFNIFPSAKKFDNIKMRILHDGTRILKVFIISVSLSIVFLFVEIFALELGKKYIIVNSVLVVIAEFILFWNGMIRVYCTSTQLGIKWRVIGIVCGMIPVVHLIMLFKIISVTDREYGTEKERFQTDAVMSSQKLCETKYPVLLVHGVFFRDTNFFNYWGRIPDTLIRNGAEIYYGQQQSAASVEDSGKELAERIRKIVEETGCEKVNIIAHSKGGLDSRYAISRLGMDKYVASLTTINTPHRGCLFADYLLGRVSDKFSSGVAKKYNCALRKLGDTNPDFLAAVNDLTAARCRVINEECPDIDGVYYQSVGSKLKKAYNGQFPLNLSTILVRHFDGANDGLVSEMSMKWGAKFTFFEPEGRRGISHGDVIDLNRENIRGFDVRSIYIRLVNDLKERGL